MNTTFNSALKQGTSIRKDLAALSTPSAANGSLTITPAALGSLSASLTSFSRTLDEYSNLAKQELNPAKQEKAFDRLKGFRAELAEFRAQFDSLQSQRDDAIHSQNRNELLGRRPFVSATPENPYANATPSSSSGYGVSNGYGHARSTSGGGGSGGMDLGSGDVTREAHAAREQNFFASTNQALDEYIGKYRMELAHAVSGIC